MRARSYVCQVTSADIGIMQVNDNNDGQTVTLPVGHVATLHCDTIFYKMGFG